MWTMIMAAWIAMALDLLMLSMARIMKMTTTAKITKAKNNDDNAHLLLLLRLPRLLLPVPAARRRLQVESF